jgi:hypothetical protein
LYSHRGEAALEEVAGPARAGVDEVGVAPVRFADRQAQSQLVGRRQDQVDGVWHEAVGPGLDAALARLFGDRAGERYRVPLFHPLPHTITLIFGQNYIQYLE